MVERCLVAAVLILTAVGPPLLVEQFPISAAHMFAETPEFFWVYRLTDNDGRKLDNDVYGLRSNSCWYLEHTYGVKFPPNVIAPPTDDADTSAVIKHVRQIGLDRNARFPLTLSAVKMGDRNGASVGVLSTQTWVVDERQ